MATRFQNFRFAITGLKPARFLALRPRLDSIALPSAFSPMNCQLAAGVHPSPYIFVIHGVGTQTRKKFRSLQTNAADLQGRFFDGLRRYLRSSSLHSLLTSVKDRPDWAVSNVTTANHRQHYCSTALMPGAPESCSWIANNPLMGCRDLDSHVRNYSARILPNQGSQKNQNQAYRLLRAFMSPIDRQKRMNQNEENNVNQRIAVRRESDRDRRR